MSSADKRFWLVEHSDGSMGVDWRRTYPFHFYSELQMESLLRSLAARSSLTYREIAEALCRKGKRTTLLDVVRLDMGKCGLACGPSLEWTARVIDEQVRETKPDLGA
jgi:hypothetical protein